MKQGVSLNAKHSAIFTEIPSQGPFCENHHKQRFSASLSQIAKWNKDKSPQDWIVLRRFFFYSLWFNTHPFLEAFGKLARATDPKGETDFTDGHPSIKR
jgi:hypothetical protein